jgi:hypothetical protein
VTAAHAAAAVAVTDATLAVTAAPAAAAVALAATASLVAHLKEDAALMALAFADALEAAESLPSPWEAQLEPVSVAAFSTIPGSTTRVPRSFFQIALNPKRIVDAEQSTEHGAIVQRWDEDSALLDQQCTFLASIEQKLSLMDRPKTLPHPKPQPKKRGRKRKIEPKPGVIMQDSGGKRQRTAAAAARKALKKTADADSKYSERLKRGRGEDNGVGVGKRRRITLLPASEAEPSGSDSEFVPSEDDENEGDDQEIKTSKIADRSASTTAAKAAATTAAKAATTAAAKTAATTAAKTAATTAAKAATTAAAKTATTAATAPSSTATAAASVATAVAATAAAPDVLGRTSVYNGPARMIGSEAMGDDNVEANTIFNLERSQVLQELRADARWQRVSALPTPKFDMQASLNYHTHISRDNFEPINTQTGALESVVTQTLDEAYMALMRVGHITTFSKLLTIQGVRGYFFELWSYMVLNAQHALTPRAISFGLYAMAYCIDSPETEDHQDYRQIVQLLGLFNDFGDLGVEGRPNFAGHTLDDLHPIPTEVLRFTFCCWRLVLLLTVVADCCC